MRSRSRLIVSAIHDAQRAEWREIPCGTALADERFYNERMPGNERMTTPASGVKLTYDDFLLFPDDGKRHELIDGEHYVTPSPASAHQIIVGNIFFHIRGFLEQHRIGRVFLSPFDVVFSRFDVVEPDILYMSHERASTILTELNVQGTPELVVEIASPSTRRRDATIKRRLYERAGVSEYWIIDPAAPKPSARSAEGGSGPKSGGVRLYRREDAGFRTPLELSLERGDVLTTGLLPGLELPLSRIFEGVGA
jgi:Uma2 family endonuclease